MRKHHAGILVATALIVVGKAHASGFAFYEQGAKASGQAGAWVARADDASANWYNPAALAFMSGREIQFGTNWVDIGSDTSFDLGPGVATFDAVANTEFPSHFYFSQKINDRVAWGIGLNNPFGLTSEWDDAPLTFSSQRGELVTYLVNPNIAFRLHELWSLAVGFDYISAEVKEFSRTTLLPGNPTANLTGEGDSVGYNVALQFKMKCFSLAGSYRSELNPNIEGDFKISGPAGNLLNSPASAEVHLPAQTMVGAAFLSKRVDVELAGYFTTWNHFDELAIITNSPLTSATLIENWDATWSYRLGVAVRLDSGLHHEIRLGGVFDETPIPVEYLRPSIPDSDRTGYTIGYGWQGGHFGIDAYAMQIDFDDITANGSPADGVINGTYTSSILLIGGTLKYRF
jgi:long-chain fatty acid transport protein